VWSRLFTLAGSFLPKHLRYTNAGEKVHRVAEMMIAQCPEEIYLQLLSHWEDPAGLVLATTEPDTPITSRSEWLDCPDFTHRMMYLDTITYLPDDVLVKVDRAAMEVSLETRVPLLDHRLVEFAWRLPLS